MCSSCATCAQQLHPEVFAKGPESLSLVRVSEDDLSCSVSNVDAVKAVPSEGLSNQEIFIAQFTVKDTDIVCLHRDV